jgi:hypothetical protein
LEVSAGCACTSCTTVVINAAVITLTDLVIWMSADVPHCCSGFWIEHLL